MVFVSFSVLLIAFKIHDCPIPLSFEMMFWKITTGRPMLKGALWRRTTRKLTTLGRLQFGRFKNATFSGIEVPKISKGY